MKTRIEKDSLGEVEVPEDAYWGAQTQRAYINFDIGDEHFPPTFIHALAIIKHAAATVNAQLGGLHRKYQTLSVVLQTKLQKVNLLTNSRSEYGKQAVVRRHT